jgi:hypothetical protein
MPMSISTTMQSQTGVPAPRNELDCVQMGMERDRGVGVRDCDSVGVGTGLTKMIVRIKVHFEIVHAQHAGDADERANGEEEDEAEALFYGEAEAPEGLCGPSVSRLSTHLVKGCGETDRYIKKSLKLFSAAAATNVARMLIHLGSISMSQ